MNRPWMKWYPSDWRGDPRLRMCSLAARGLWVDLISYMHEGDTYGHLVIHGARPTEHDIAALIGRPLHETRKALAELEGKQVFSRMDDGTIYSRRMVRDKAKEDRDQKNGMDGGNPDIRRGTVPKADRSRPFRRSDAPAKTQRIFDRDEGKCHWCRAELVTTIEQGQPLPPNFFHVDHVIPICDGGTNDEDNLVASCADCNHKRARNQIPTSTQVSVGNNSDVKAQKLEARNQNPESKTSLRSDAIEPEKKTRRKPEVALPENWRPSKTTITYAKTQGLFDSEIVRELERFSNHARQRDRRCADWEAAFRNWCLKAAEERGRAPDVPPETAAVQSGVWLSADDDRFKAWEKFSGKTYPRDKNFGWRFPSESPPIGEQVAA